MAYTSSLVAGVLSGFSLHVLWERVPNSGWVGVGFAVFGFLLYAAIDRFVHPICAICRIRCEITESGTASRWPLVVLTGALAIHSLMDGALLATNEGLRWAVLVHWGPETIAVYCLLRSIAKRREAWLAFGFLQSTMAFGFTIAHRLPFALEATMAATGAVCYLAVHGLHESYGHAPRNLWVSAGIAGLIIMALH